MMLIFRNLGKNVLHHIRSDCGSLFERISVRGISFSPPLDFNLTPCLMMMPLRKRKRIDPQVLKAREEKKKRRIEKEVRQLEKLKRCPRPIEEARMPSSIYYDRESRTREVTEVSEDIKEERVQNLKMWSYIKLKESIMDSRELKRIMWAQKKALLELQKESDELYRAAVQIDANFMPFAFKGPAETPPVQGYNPPDGEYIDITKNWFAELKRI